MKFYLGLLLCLGVLSSLYGPIGESPFIVGGTLTMNAEMAERVAHALNDPDLLQENEELKAQIEALENKVTQQSRSIWRMRLVFILAAAGFCYGIGKKIYQSLNQEKKDVSPQAYGLLQKPIKS